jgi:peptidoglycan/LPS O-acetylase OafA/YrhL
VVKNNFNFLRLLFAVFVLITHSNKLSGAAETDWLHTITHGQIHFSYIGLYGLFTLSGYLIFQSLCRSKNPLVYYWKRILRIFPALFVVLVLTLLLGSIVYNGNLSSYFQLPTMRSYLTNNLSLLKIQYDIEGVFENNPVKRMINGSLWSIPYEFAMYLSLSLFFYFRLSLKRIIVSCIFLFLLLVQLFFSAKVSQFNGILSGTYFLELAVYFYAGCFLAAVQFEKIGKNSVIFLLCVLLVFFSVYFQFHTYSKFFIWPVLVISGGLAYVNWIQKLTDILGDLSYGVYLYAFPVQQTLMYYFNFTTLPLMILSLIVSLGFAGLSWHIVEKNAIKLKTLWVKS